MSDMFTNNDIFSSHRKMMRVFVALVLACVLFVIGIFLSGLFDKYMVNLMSEIRGRVKQRYGISTSVGQVETGFGSIRLGEVNIGEPAWMAVDHIEISVSLNPFAGFLKPKAMTIGRAVVKVPWSQDRWPQEVRLVYDAIKRRNDDVGSNSKAADLGLSGRLIPRHLKVNAATIEFADGAVTRFLGEKLNINLDLIDKKISFLAGRVHIPDWLDESLIEGDLNLQKEGVFSGSLLSRIKDGEPATWSFACEGKRDGSLAITDCP